MPARHPAVDPEIRVVCHFRKGGPPRRNLPGALRILPFIITLAAVVAVSLGASGAQAPTLTRPIDDLEIEAGTTIVGVLDLSTHFEAAGGEPLRFAVVEADGSAPADPEGPFVRLVEARLDVVAPSTGWTGVVRFQVEACVGAGADSACTRSNVFQVTVSPATQINPDVNPPGTGLTPSASFDATAAGDGLVVLLRVDGGLQVLSPPRWFLDGNFVAEGYSAQITGLTAGPHVIEARFLGNNGPVVVKQDFYTMLPPVKGGLTTAQLAALGFGGILLGAVVAVGRSARLRRPLVLFIVNSVFTRLKDESLLDHFNRGALHQVIKENPGIHFSELRRRVGISHGSAVYHLRALEKGGYVQAVATGAYTRYFSTGQDLDDATYGLSPADTAMLAAVTAAPGISLGDLSAQTGRSLGTTSRAVSRLASLGYVTTERSRRKRLVYPRPERAVPPGPAQHAGGGAKG